MATATFSKLCPFCRKITIFTEDSIRLAKWQNGELIQNVFPEKSASERETMISGTCPECWDKFMDIPEEDD